MILPLHCSLDNRASPCLYKEKQQTTKITTIIRKSLKQTKRLQWFPSKVRIKLKALTVMRRDLQDTAPRLCYVLLQIYAMPLTLFPETLDCWAVSYLGPFAQALTFILQVSSKRAPPWRDFLNQVGYRPASLLPSGSHLFPSQHSSQHHL